MSNQSHSKVAPNRKLNTITKGGAVNATDIFSVHSFHHHWILYQTERIYFNTLHPLYITDLRLITASSSCADNHDQIAAVIKAVIKLSHSTHWEREMREEVREAHTKKKKRVYEL